MNKGLINDNTEGVRDLRCTLRPLKEVWMTVGMEKVDTYEGVTVRALLDSGAMGMFADKKFVEKNGFKMKKLDRAVKVRNVDGTENNGGTVTHEIECNVYFKGHVERMRLDVCDLGRTEVILDMPWLAAHNPTIDWEKGEVKMTRCPPLCGRNEKIKRDKERKEVVRRRETRKMEEEKAISWTADEKEDWGREEEIEIDHWKVERMVPERFHQWLKVFRKVELERIPVRKVWDHAIDLKEDFKASKAKVYPLLRNKRDEVQQFVNEHLRKGYIRPTKSQQMSLVFFVGKKDGGKRMVMDYCKLNRQMVKNNYLLPLITDLVDTMGSKRVFTKMDLRWGYNNVCVKERDEWKVALTTHVGSFEPVVMFFGMTNSPATFQAMMNEILRDMINEGKVAAFVDNVLVGTETEEGYDEIVKEVLKRLEENDLYVKPKKCVWKARKIPFLGVVMGEGNVEMEKEKVEGVLKWLMPQYVRDVRKFLGLANYYRQFVKNFAKVALPINRLTRKDEKWKWGEEQQAAFEQLKAVFTTRPVLATPDLDKEFRVEADASNFATRGVLSVRCEDNLWRPMSFISKALNKTECNYEIHNKEMLGVIRCLEAWRHFLEGSRVKFEIWTDHKNLEYFMTSQNSNCRQARWALYLSRFDFTKVSLFKANNGQDPRMGFEVRKKEKYERAEKFVEKMKEIQGEAKAALAKAQEDMKKYVDRHRSEAVEYKVGDLVLLSTKDLKWQMISRRSKKLTERFVGPYKIKVIISSNAVELELPSTIKIHPVVNVSRIRRYTSQVNSQSKEVPQPVIIEGEEE